MSGQHSKTANNTGGGNSQESTRISNGLWVGGPPRLNVKVGPLLTHLRNINFSMGLRSAPYALKYSRILISKVPSVYTNFSSCHAVLQACLMQTRLLFVMPSQSFHNAEQTGTRSLLSSVLETSHVRTT